MSAEPTAVPAAPLAAVGVTGLGVMGANLARNIARHGYTVAVHNRTGSRTDRFMANFASEGAFIPAADVADFVASLARPRVVILMVTAGPGTDAAIATFLPYLEAGDIVVDAGNSHFADSERRAAELEAHGLVFVGCGVSGGEEGALLGPAIMPGGTPESYAHLGPILEAIAAQVDDTPCCTYIGPGGAGHFVKMVHNGIEYADMELICESYQILRTLTGMTPAQLAELFGQWNQTELSSYLIEITAEVLGQVDAVTGGPFIDIVDDAAGQKGTGLWTTQSALDLGTPTTGIAEATFARMVSSDASGREVAQGCLPPLPVPASVAADDVAGLVEDVRRALYAAKIMAYTQGFDQIAHASREHDWGISPGDLATIWRGGCIIRAQFLDEIRRAYAADPALPSLLADSYFADAVAKGEAAWRRIVKLAITSGIPVPTFAVTLTTLDALRSPRLSTALIQGQRDYFGAHTYRRVDRPGSFHTLWAGDGSEVAA